MCPPFLVTASLLSVWSHDQQSCPNPPARRPGTCLLRLQHDDAQWVTVIISFLVKVKQGPRKRRARYSRPDDNYGVARERA